MQVLLDTHVLLWLLIAPQQLPVHLHQALEDPSHDVVLQAARAAHLTELPVRAEPAARVSTLELLHHDPFDRPLI